MSSHEMIVDRLREGPSNGILWQIIHDGKTFIFSTILKNRYSWKYISELEHLNNINEALGSIPHTTRKEGRKERERGRKKGGSFVCSLFMSTVPLYLCLRIVS